MTFHIHRPEELGTNEEGTISNVDEPRLLSVWKGKVRDEKAFKVARPGDHLLIPFECDMCIFIKLKDHLPDPSSPPDQLLMSCIRRMNLDAFWSRETSTVKANTRRANKLIEASSTFQMPGPFFHQGPLPLFDHCGYRIAVSMLLLSRNPGKHNNTYTQFDTIRSYRSTFSNFTRASSINNRSSLSLGDLNGNYQRLSHDEAGSFFFKRFMEGLRSRMGQVHKPNLAMSIDLFLELIKKLNSKLEQCSDIEDSHLWSSMLTYVVVSYVISLRGPEGFLLDLKGLNQFWDRSESYVTIALLGRLKGEHHDLQHLIPCVNYTSSGIQVRKILGNHLRLKELAQTIDGPAISNREGKILTSKFVDDTVHELLNDIFQTSSNLFPPSIDTPEKITTSYQCFRSFRRTSATRAAEMGVSTTDVNAINRWQETRSEKRKKSTSNMHQHYTQFDLLIKPFLRYTFQM